VTGEVKAAFVLMMAGTLSALLLAVFVVFSQESPEAAVLSGKKEKLKESLEMVKYESVSIYYAEEDRPILELTKETLRDAAGMNRELFASPLQDSVDLIFFSNRDDMESFSKLKDITGFYSNDMRMIGLLPEERRHLNNGEGFAVFLYKRVLVHEYTHYAFHVKLRELNADPAAYPLWFHEGVAEWASAHDTIEIRTLPSVVPLSKLKTDRQWQKARTGYETDIYLQSYYLIEELAEKKGRGVILDIIEETAERGSFEDGFKAAVGQSLTGFEKEFKRKYEAKKTAWKVSSFRAVFIINE